MIAERVLRSANTLAQEYIRRGNLMPVEVGFLFITRVMLQAIISDEAKFNFSKDFVRPALEFCMYLTQKESVTKAEREFIDGIIVLHVEIVADIAKRKH